MNRLKALQDGYLAKLATVEGLTAKDNLTDDELKTVKDLATELKSMKTEIEELKSAEKDLDELKRFATEPANRLKMGDPEAPEKKFERGKRVGTDLVDVYEFGGVKVDHEGFELSEKQFYAMQEDSYLKAWRNYLRKGEQGLSKTDYDELTQVKNLQGGIDTQVGFLVPPQMIMEIIQRDPQRSGLKDEVRIIPCSSDRLVFPKLDYTSGTNDANGDIFTNPLRIARTGETESPGNPGRPNVGTIEIPIHEGSMELPITRALMQDAAVDIASWVAGMMNESFLLDSERELTLSLGTNGPVGILGGGVGGANQIPVVNIGNAVTGDGLIDLYYSLPQQYRANAKLMLNDTNVYRTWAKIKDNDGSYIFGLMKTTDGGMATPRGEVFLGKPMVFNPFMPDGAAAANVCVWGDFRRAYYYGLRLGMTLEMQMLPRDPFAYAVFRFRDGGRTVQPRALRVGRQS